MNEVYSEKYPNRIEDADEVVSYLKKRFDTEKVYLMAHSGGSMLGMRLAQQQPENFHCYFAMGQVVSEGNMRYEAGYDFMKKVFEDTWNKKALSKLNKLIEKKNGVYEIKETKMLGAKWESILLMAGCATTKEMRSDAREIFFPQMFRNYMKT